MTVRDRMVLTLASTPYKFPAVRVTHALEQVGYGETRFWARVGWLLEQGDAEAEMPVEVRRLRRLRDARARARNGAGC